MKAQVFSHEHLIGSVELGVIDAASATLAGELQCAPYFNQIAHILQDINSGLPRGNNMSMDELRINVQLENGWFLFPAKGFSIRALSNDATQNEECKFELRAIGVMPHVIENFFIRTPAREWPLQPWQAPDIVLKLKMEDELLREIGLLKDEVDKVESTQEAHPLTEFELCSQAQFKHQRESLFAARHRQSGRETFVMIFLTWTGQCESKPWPMFQFFDSWARFRRTCVRYGEDIKQYLNTPAQKQLYRRYSKEKVTVDAVVYSGNTCIGTGRLFDYDRSMGVIGGPFIPNENYKSVRHLIWKFFEGNSPEQLKYLNAVDLNVQIRDGIFLSPCGGIQIFDIEDMEDHLDELEVAVAGLHWQIIENFLDRALPLPWIGPTWRMITIEEKLDFEQRLDHLLFSRESKGVQSPQKMLPVRSRRFQYGTLAINSANNKVLFDLQGSNHGQFVIVDFDQPDGAFEFFEERHDLP